MRSFAFVAVAFAIFAAARPIARRGSQPIPIQRIRKIPAADQPMNIVAHDRARAQNLVAKASGAQKARQESVGATNALDTYTLQVGVGSPETTYTLLIDTGSSNTWVGASTAYNPTSTSQDTGDSVSVSYGSGSFSGEEYIDQVDLGSGLVINQQSIGVAASSQGFDGVDGILGIGPIDLTEDTVSGENTVPTVTDNLYAQGTISEEVIGIFFAPTTSNDDVNGELTFGGVDASKITSDITYTPITSTSPASQYWGIDETISYGETEILNSAGIVDTGTTLILLATDAFDKYKKAISGSSVDENSGLLEIPETSVASMKSLNYVIGGTTFELTAEAQLLPQSLNTFYGGDEGKYYSLRISALNLVKGSTS